MDYHEERTLDPDPAPDLEDASSSGSDHLVACHHCDLLVEMPFLEEGARALCPRCSHSLGYVPHGGRLRILSLTLAASGLFALSMMYPFMTFSGMGQEKVMTLLGSVLSLFQYDSAGLAVVFGALVIALPGAYLACLLTILIPMALGRRRPEFPRLARIATRLAPWAMVDVFLLGVLVSLTKIASLATVELGISFWAFLFFAGVFSILLPNLDKSWLWKEWELLNQR